MERAAYHETSNTVLHLGVSASFLYLDSRGVLTVDATDIIILGPPTIRLNRPPVDVETIVIVASTSRDFIGSAMLGPTIQTIAS